MDVEIMGRTAVIKYSSKPHDERSIVISISDIHNEAPRLIRARANGIIEQLKINFDDIENESPRRMTDEQANIIANFVRKFQNKVDRIVVNCEAGISRSAGIAAAIIEYLGGNNWDVFNSREYCPNITCYRRMLIALHMTLDEPEIFEKIKVNRKIWDKRWLCPGCGAVLCPDVISCCYI